jgi:hypothetical protein
MKHSTSVMQQINHLMEVLAIVVVQVGYLTKFVANVAKNCSFDETFDDPNEGLSTTRNLGHPWKVSMALKRVP